MNRFLVLALLFVACTKSADAPTSAGAAVVVPPHGSAVGGVTFAGKLAGKTMYLMPANMAPASCWIDSQAWTGSELFFGISSINWTKLNQQSVLQYDSSCAPQPGFQTQTSPGTTGNFNMYRATVAGGSWVLTNLSLNVGQTASVAAPKLSGSQLFFVKYEKASAAGNIYIAQRTGDNSFSTPVAFSLNSSTCNEDNPFPSGQNVIFESSRTSAAGTSCGSVQKLWSSTYNGSTWSTPVQVTLPSSTQSVTQPFAADTNLFWTASGSDCTGSVSSCVKVASGSGTTFTTSPQQIITPTTPGLGWAGGGMLGLVGQYTEANGYAFVACGIVQDVDPSGSTAGLIFNRFAINIQTCVIE